MTSLDLDTARAIVRTTLTKGRELGLAPLSVVVLDAGGHLKAFEREDGASNLRFQIAHGKAYGAIGLGVGSRALMVRAEKQPYFVSAATAAIGGALIPVPGGLLAKDADGVIVGAVGVTGDTSDNDEVCGLAGITAAGLIAETG